MLRFLVCLYLTITYATIVAQDSLCKISDYTFEVGEEVTYKAYYNWKFIWLNAGDVLFTVNDTVYNDQPAFYFISKGWSLKEYDWIFKVRDNFESIVAKENFKPLWFLRETNEGGLKTFNRYEFDHEKNHIKVVSFTSKRPYKEEKLQLQNCAFDVLSAIYYCRNLDFNSYIIGDKIPLTMLIDNGIYNLYIRYLGKENISLRDNNSYNTIKFSVMLVEGTIFKGGEDMTIWVSDDENRVPLMIEAKILVGSVKAIISGSKGLINSKKPN